MFPIQQNNSVASPANTTPLSPLAGEARLGPVQPNMLATGAGPRARPEASGSPPSYHTARAQAAARAARALLAPNGVTQGRPDVAQRAAQVASWAQSGRWHEVVGALATASDERRLSLLLSTEVAGGSLASCLLQALARREGGLAAEPALPDDCLAALASAALRCREAAAFHLWQGIQGERLAHLVALYPGLACQAATHPPLMRAFLAPLDASQRSALFLAQAPAIVGTLVGQARSDGDAAVILGELVDNVLLAGDQAPTAARHRANDLITRAPALLVGTQGRMAAIAARLREATGLAAPSI